jgi:Zn-dependent protease/DNA-directed RNA polymerase subunit RPC12/RpoP
MPTRQGAIKIFRLFGISVYLHWAWFIVAYLMIKYRMHNYTSPIFNVLEYLSLFMIVLTHEFGHQLACRSVGGQTHDIILWPFGGVAYVSPPQRPGAQLWSIAAGPLVNVVLVPVLSLLWLVSFRLGWQDTSPNVYQLVQAVWGINIGLLIFNMMPIYPLDGGQILRSLLWFVIGRANSLLAASIVGFIGMGGLLLLALLVFFEGQDAWTGGWICAIACIIALSCWSGLRGEGFACPSCNTAPPLGELWRCGKCGQAFDTFLTQATCPHCGAQYSATQCLDCGTSAPIAAWYKPSAEFRT